MSDTSNQVATPAADTQSNDALRTLCIIIYALYGASILTGLTALAGVIMAYVKRSDAVGTVYESHLTYLIRTFWISFAGAMAGAFLMIFGIGVLILIATAVWFIYRCIVGVLKLIEGKPIANPTGLF